jgi:O-antigen/teichoic acid export membrane protein
MSARPMGTGEPPIPERRLRSDVFLMAGSKGFMIVLNAIAGILTARYLGASGRGILAVALSITILLVQVGHLGFESGNTYYVAKRPELRGAVVGNSIWAAALIGTVLFGVGVLIRAGVPDVVKGVGWLELVVALAGLPAALLTPFLRAAMFGEARTVAYNVFDVVLAMGQVAAMWIGFAVFNMSVLGALCVTTGYYFLASITYVAYLARTGPVRLLPDIGLARDMMGYGTRIYIASLLGFALLRIDMLFVNGFLGARQAGLYSVAVGLADAVMILPVTVGLNVFPRIVRREGAEMTAEIFRTVSIVYAVICVATIPVASVAITLLYGETFSPATSLYFWLLPGVYSLGTLNILQWHFAARGFPWTAVLVWVPALLLNMTMNAILLPVGGTFIASLSSSIAYTLLLVLHLRLFAHQHGGYSALRPRFGETVAIVRTALGRVP